MSALYTLNKTILSKIFNQEELIKTLDTKDILDNMNNLPYNCTTSIFTDLSHGHIVTGDINNVQNYKLKKLLCKGPKYRNKFPLNFQTAKLKKNRVPYWCNKKGVNVICFTQWISLVTEKVNESIKKIKDKFTFRKVKQVLRDLKFHI